MQGACGSLVLAAIGAPCCCCCSTQPTALYDVIRYNRLAAHQGYLMKEHTREKGSRRICTKSYSKSINSIDATTEGESHGRGSWWCIARLVPHRRCALLRVLVPSKLASSSAAALLVQSNCCAVCSICDCRLLYFIDIILIFVHNEKQKNTIACSRVQYPLLNAPQR